MQGDAKVIQHLNIILKNELTAINQYFLHARMLKDWGIFDLPIKSIKNRLRNEACGYLVERILTIDGLPNLQDMGKLKIGEDVPEMLEADLGAETNNQSCLKEAIVVCEGVRDFLSREVLERILDDTEEHIDWIETQQTLIEGTGIQNYLQEQMFSGDED